MQGTGIAADKKPAAIDEGPQLGQIELPKIQHPTRGRTEGLPRRGCDPRGGVAIGWPRTEHDTPLRRSRGQFGDDGRKCQLGPASERIAGADVDDYELVSAADSRRLEPMLDLSLGSGVRCHFYGIPCTVRPAGGPSVNRFEKVPLVHDGVPSSKFPRPRHHAGIHPRPPGNFVPDSLRRSRQPCQPRTARAPV